MKNLHPVVQNDLDFLLHQLQNDTDPLKKSTVFITGGTGFFGKWLTLTLCYLNIKLNLDLKIYILSRSPDNAKKNFPEVFKDKAINFVKGDLASFKLPAKLTHIDFLIHLAVDSTDSQADSSKNQAQLDRHQLNLSYLLRQLTQFKPKKVLLTSSGAIYGFPTKNVIARAESDFESSISIESYYAQCKQLDEAGFTIYCKKFEIPLVIARCFSFIGPYLDPQKHYAASQFIANTINYEPIYIRSTGLDTRSYLYAADLALWLTKLLLKPSSNLCEIFNVGSEKAITIKDLAASFSKVSGLPLQQEDLKTPHYFNSYYPDTKKIQQELSLLENFTLTTAVKQTIDFYALPPLKLKPSMKLASFIVSKPYQKDRIFELDNSLLNRDNCLYPFFLLRKELLTKDIQLRTQDLHAISNSQFILYNDMPKTLPKRISNSNQKHILLLFESKVIRPDNWVLSSHDYFDVIFTWHDNYVDGIKYFKFNFPAATRKNNFLKFKEKSHFCTLIAGHKSSNHELELYSKRKEVITWFENHAPSQFDYYGAGWNRIDASTSTPLKIIKKLGLLKYFPQKTTPCYKGRVTSKVTTLSGYKFAICFENARDIEGYITEKITDCLLAGCVPIYWGAPNIEDHIDKKCYIDYKKYNSIEKLYVYLDTMTENEYNKYLSNIEDYLASKKFSLFTDHSFVTVICDKIL